MDIGGRLRGDALLLGGSAGTPHAETLTDSVALRVFASIVDAGGIHLARDRFIQFPNGCSTHHQRFGSRRHDTAGETAVALERGHRERGASGRWERWVKVCRGVGVVDVGENEKRGGGGGEDVVRALDFGVRRDVDDERSVAVGGWGTHDGGVGRRTGVDADGGADDAGFGGV